MIQETIAKIETQLQKSSAGAPENRAELLGLLGTLKAEISELSKTDAEQAQSIAGFAAVSTHEATREAKNPELLKHSLGGLSSSVAGFEKTHPQLVQIVNSICNALSNLGI